MTLLYNPEQEEFRSAIRRFLDQHAPESMIRQWADSENGIRPRPLGVTWP